MANTVIPGPILDSFGQPANGYLYGEQTARMEVDGALVTAVRVKSRVVDGVPFLDDGVTPLEAPPTPDGESMIFVEDFRPYDKQVSRSVIIPASGPAPYATLQETAKPATLTTWVVPGWARNSAEDVEQVAAAVVASQAAAASAEDAAAAAAAVGDTNDTIMAGVAANPGSAFAAQLSTTIVDLGSDKFVPLGADHGEWLSTTSFPIGSQVTYRGRLWQRLVTGAVEASFDPTKWQFIGAIAGGWGNTVVLFGNSRFALERMTSGSLAGIQQRGIFFWANMFLRQRLNILAYGGISGNTLADMGARWATDVRPFVPSIVVVADHVNDVSGGATLTQLKSRYNVIIRNNRTIGARTVILTTNPRDANTTAENLILAQANEWLTALTEPDVLVIDVTSSVINPSAATWATDLATDGLHQSRMGAARIGRRVADALENLIPERPVLPVGFTATNHAPNPYADGTPGATTTITGFTVFPTTDADVTWELVARTDQQPGNWIQVTVENGATDVFLNTEVALSGWAVSGDAVRVVCEIETDAWTAVAANGLRLYLQFLNASNTVLSTTNFGSYISTTQVGDGGDTSPFSIENQPGLNKPAVLRTLSLNAPSTATKAKLLIECNFEGVARFGNFGILKM